MIFREHISHTNRMDESGGICDKIEKAIDEHAKKVYLLKMPLWLFKCKEFHEYGANDAVMAIPLNKKKVYNGELIDYRPADIKLAFNIPCELTIKRKEKSLECSLKPKREFYFGPILSNREMYTVTEVKTVLKAIKYLMVDMKFDFEVEV